MASDISKHGK